MNYAGNQSTAAVGVFPATAGGLPLAERIMATPRLACEALCRALNNGDLEAALGCFSPGGCLIAADGTACQGEAAVRERLAELIARGARIEIELRGVLVAAEVALAHERWQITYGGVPDPALAKAPAPTMVLRWLEEEWRIAIAAPWGTTASPPLRAIWP